jgi:hypothetical protein
VEHFNPDLNFHRPCGVPELKTDGRGKTKRVYKVYATPLEILLNLKELRLKDGVTGKQLEKLAGAQSDTGAAMKMRKRNENCSATLTMLSTGGQRDGDCGNDGPWTERKTKGRFSHPAHSPRKPLRHSHIPTVTAAGPPSQQEKENQ